MRCAWWLVCALAACTASASSTAQPITNGTPATGDPAVIALVDPEGRVACTASVIGPHSAITASHCVSGRDARTLRAAFGSTIAGATFIAISDARTHPMFDAGTLGYDVAMLTLRDAAPVAPLALDTRTIDASLVGTTFRVVGFGNTASGVGDSGTKREGTARISEVAADEITALPDPSQPCRGDSGGPALLAATAVAAVVSRGDAACSDHAIYARIDVARAILVDPYLAETAPGTVHTGDACLYEGHCAEGPCLQTTDDPLLYFCSAPCEVDADCPSAMECAADGCRYPVPSPGALGAPCAGDGDCSGGTCREQVCTVSCFTDSSSCPVGYECRGGALTRYCFVAESGGCGCTSGSSAPVWLVVIWFGFARARRSGRSASRRDTRA